MRLWRMLALMANVIAAVPAGAQTRPPGAPLYTEQPSTELDRNYGLPSFGMPGAELPRRTTTAPVPSPPDPFKESTGLVSPDAQPSDVPDFFTDSKGFNPTDTQATGPTNFFNDAQGIELPKAPAAVVGETMMDTPMFTTGEGLTTDTPPADPYTTGDTTSQETTPGRRAMSDPATNR